MGQFSIGREASFTYADGPETLITNKFNRVAFRISRRAWPTTPPKYLMNRVTLGILTATGAIGNWHDKTDATPPSPGGVGAPSATVGTLTIATSTGKSYAFKAMLVELEGSVSMEDGGPPYVYQYAFISSAQSETDTITVT